MAAIVRPVASQVKGYFRNWRGAGSLLPESHPLIRVLAVA